MVGKSSDEEETAFPGGFFLTRYEGCFAYVSSASDYLPAVLYNAVFGWNSS